MIIVMPNTETREISARIDQLHEERGEAAQGRVLTLLISTTEQELESALSVANNASREHPCRVIAIAPYTSAQTQSATTAHDQGPDAAPQEQAGEERHTFLDAEIRFGSDAGAGEIIVLRPRGGLVHHEDTLVIPLLVPDAPVVAWWPTDAPADPSRDLLGAMANSRITDAMRSSNPARTMDDLRRNRSPKNIDLSWTRLTIWRALLATMLDQPPHNPVLSATVCGPRDFLPTELLAAWLRLRLGVPVLIDEQPTASAVTGVSFTRADGTLRFERPEPDSGAAQLCIPGQAPQHINVPKRSLEECLNEELRRLNPDEVYGEVISQGWKLIHPEH